MLTFPLGRTQDSAGVVRPDVVGGRSADDEGGGGLAVRGDERPLWTLGIDGERLVRADSVLALGRLDVEFTRQHVEQLLLFVVDVVRERNGLARGDLVAVGGKVREPGGVADRPLRRGTVRRRRERRCVDVVVGHGQT